MLLKELRMLSSRWTYRRQSRRSVNNHMDTPAGNEQNQRGTYQAARGRGLSVLVRLLDSLLLSWI